MRGVRDVFGRALEDDRLGLARQMRGDRRICHEIAHPARLGRPTEAERAVDPHAVDRARVRGDGRDPVVRRGPNALLDPAPRKTAVRFSRRAVCRGKADGTHPAALTAHRTLSSSRTATTTAAAAPAHAAAGSWATRRTA